MATASDEAGLAAKRTKRNHSSYPVKDCAFIGKYAAEHRPNKVSWHFKVPESTACLMKKQSLVELNAQCLNCQGGTRGNVSSNKAMRPSSSTWKHSGQSGERVC